MERIAQQTGTSPEGNIGYTFGMKTAVSIPDEIFQNAERLARRMKKSRSEVYSRALSEYVSRHSLNETTLAMNAALEDIGDTRDAFPAAAASKVLERAEW